MDLLTHFDRLLKYDGWANCEVLASLQALSNPPAECVRLLAHVMAAEHVWLARLTGTSSPLAVWPDLSLAQCGEHITRLQSGFRGYYQRELPAGFDRIITYKNSQGQSWSSRVEDILTHTWMHSTCHRGQIAYQVRQAGYTPAYTDFIHGVRQGLLE